MKYLLILTLSFLAQNLKAQESILIFDQYNVNYNYDWRGLRSFENHTELANDFILLLAKTGEHVTIPYELKKDNRELINKLDFVDINADGKSDVIYSGPSGGESNIVEIFVFNKDKYELVFSVMQGIVKVNWANDRIVSILTHDWGCCAENRIINSEYQVEYLSNGIPTFKKILDIVENRRTVKPKDFLVHPIEFITQNDNYKLRLAPILDDSTYLGYITEHEKLGNSLGTLEKGTKGIAYATASDNTGRIWWYVAISSEYPLNESVIYMEDLSPNSCYIGWISSRFVKQLED